MSGTCKTKSLQLEVTTQGQQTRGHFTACSATRSTQQKPPASRLCSEHPTKVPRCSAITWKHWGTCEGTQTASTGYSMNFQRINQGYQLCQHTKSLSTTAGLHINMQMQPVPAAKPICDTSLVQRKILQSVRQAMDCAAVCTTRCSVTVHV